MSVFSVQDEEWMLHAFELADKAETLGEVPVGAVLVREQQLLGEGYNAPISQQDATAHAEIQAIRSACNVVANYRLPDSTLYVTLEPCSMCAGAIIHARIARVVFATTEPRAGAGGSVLNLLQNPDFNHQCEVQAGLLQPQGEARLKSFFRQRRQTAAQS